jgi:teichuronic acid biosynthesis glycosyltransferase TuaC
MRILWVHNNYRNISGSFMWDIADSIENDNFEIFFHRIPLFYGKNLNLKSHKIFHSGIDFDIVHAQFGSLVSAISMMQKSKVRLLTLRGSDIYWRYGHFYDWASGYIRVAISKVSIFRHTAIIVMSHAMRNTVSSWIISKGKPIHVVPDPVNTMFWPAGLSSIKDQILNSPHRILVSAFFATNPVKRTGIIVDAVELCKAAGIQVSLRQLSGESRETVKDAIVDSDCVAIASTHEGWPNIIKEALLLGKPFVATDVSDLRDFATAQNDNHIVPAHPVDFACAWVDQIAAQILAPHGIAINLAQFHPDVVVLKHHLIYVYYGKHKP